MTYMKYKEVNHSSALFRMCCLTCGTVLTVGVVLAYLDNIIMWREPDAKGGQGVDYALSFQESAGCSAIWYPEAECSATVSVLSYVRLVSVGHVGSK